jgi:hypothetical protein
MSCGKNIATYVPIFVNAGNLENVLEKELLQTKYIKEHIE